MKTKKNILYLVITLVIFSFTILHNTIGTNVTDINKKNIDLIILFKDNVIDKNVKDIITNCGGEFIKEFPELGGIEVKCSSDLTLKIKSEDSVLSLEPNNIIKLSDEKTEIFQEAIDNPNGKSNDLYENYQWDIKRVTNNGESFNLESGNHDVVVGIIDSGVDTTHPDLIGNFLGGKNLVPAGFKDDPSETGSLDDITDRFGHGTNVAGIIAANGRTKGVAPNIGFKSYRICNSLGETNATICSSAIIAATNDRVNVINLSLESYDLKGKRYLINSKSGIKSDLGDDMAGYLLLKRAIRYAEKNGVTVVASAGNKSLDCSNKNALTNYFNNEYADYGFKYVGSIYESPGTIKDVITVSATGISNKLASYSNYGQNFIDIAAPGGDTSDMCLTTATDSGYAFVDGTSFAAPKVAAVAALIVCKNREITPKLIANKIYNTADKLDNHEHSEYYGTGMINAYSALQ
jgi:subtilisin family serine protease